MNGRLWMFGLFGYSCCMMHNGRLSLWLDCGNQRITVLDFWRVLPVVVCWRCCSLVLVDGGHFVLVETIFEVIGGTLAASTHSSKERPLLCRTDSQYYAIHTLHSNNMQKLTLTLV